MILPVPLKWNPPRCLSNALITFYAHTAYFQQPLYHRIEVAVQHLNSRHHIAKETPVGTPSWQTGYSRVIKEHLIRVVGL